MAQPPIGIDLGTSTSEIAFFENDQPTCIGDPQGSHSPVVPSVVAVDRRGSLKVGNSALSFDGDTRNFTRDTAKLLMGTDQRINLGGKSYRPEEISAQVLKHMKGMAEERLGCQVRDVVVSVPASFSCVARTSTRVAAEIAGLNVVRLINEPTAAALAFGVKNVDLEAQVLVFDFGGGTLDVTVLEMMEGVLDVKATFGEPLGGRDFDSILIQWLSSELQTRHSGAKLSEKAPALFKKAAEKIKKDLSQDKTASINVPFIASRSGEPIDLEVELSRAKFNQLISPLLDRARACVRTALDAGKVRPAQIDKILLVGGTTYIPAVRELVAEIFGKEPKAEVPPDLAVALGAAVHAASVSGKLSGATDVILSDGCQMGLGIDIVSEVGGREALVYESLIALNQKVPYFVQRQYSLLSPDQRQVRFRVYQDRTGKAVFPEDAVPTGIEGMIVDIPPALYGEPHPLVVEFSYDAGGEVRVRASIPGLNRDCNVAFNSSALRMSAEDIESARARLSAPASTAPELWRAHPKAIEFAPLIEKADKHLADIPPRERSPLAEVVSRMKDALATGNDSRIESARNELVQALFGLDEE
jgi:molecular chaperone DnaK